MMALVQFSALGAGPPCHQGASSRMACVPHTWAGVLVLGVLLTRVLLFGAYIRAPDFWKLTH